MDLLKLKYQSDLQALNKKLQHFDHYLLAESVEKTHFWLFIEKEEPFEIFRNKTIDFFTRQVEKFPALKNAALIFLPGPGIKSLIYNVTAVVPAASLVFFTTQEPAKLLPAWMKVKNDSFKAAKLSVFFLPPLTQALSDTNHKKRLAGIIAERS